MFELNYISPNGGVLRLADNPDFVLSGVDGMTETSIDISSSDVPYSDGDTINSMRAQPREMVLYFTIKQGRNVESVKRAVLSVIKPKQSGTLLWKQNGRELAIVGAVESVSMPRFTDNVTMQISLYCSDPFWNDAQYIVNQIDLIIKKHYYAVTFPMGSGIVMGQYDFQLTRSFENVGDVAVGLEITIIATGAVNNPKLERSDGLFFGVAETMVAGDTIKISTIKGKKTVTKNGVNIMPKVIPGSTWLQLEVGENVFTISSDEAKPEMYFVFEYKQKYV